MRLHVRTWNDFHGNLEPASLNIYGHFAGGAAYLAKLVKAKQQQYGSRQATVLAGDNIGASPLAEAPPPHANCWICCSSVSGISAWA